MMVVHWRKQRKMGSEGWWGGEKRGRKGEGGVVHYNGGNRGRWGGGGGGRIRGRKGKKGEGRRRKCGSAL